MNKNFAIGAAVILGIVIITGGLLALAQGGSYEITTQDPEKGGENAQVVIEEFADFQCQYCKTHSSTVAEVVEAYPEQVKLVYRDFPLPSHSKARPVAVAGVCAAQQDQFFAFHDRVFEDQESWSQPGVEIDTYLTGVAQDIGLNVEEWNQCRNSRDARQEVQSDVEEGRSRQVNATPTFFVNGEKIQTPQSFFAWRQIIEELLPESETEEEAEDEAQQNDTQEEQTGEQANGDSEAENS